MNAATLAVRSSIEWECVPETPKVIFVGRQNGRPTGIIEWSEGRYRTTTCAGKSLGPFDRVEEAQKALTSVLQVSAVPS